MVMGNFSCLFDSWAIVIIHSMYRKAESIHIKRITVGACTAICIPGHVHSLVGVDYHVLWSLSCGRIWLTPMESSSPVKPPNFLDWGNEFDPKIVSAKSNSKSSKRSCHEWKITVFRASQITCFVLDLQACISEMSKSSFLAILPQLAGFCVPCSSTGQSSGIWENDQPVVHQYNIGEASDFQMKFENFFVASKFWDGESVCGRSEWWHKRFLLCVVISRREGKMLGR